MILFSSHADPQLRGNVALLIASFISRILTATSSYNEYLISNCCVESFADAPSLEDLVQRMLKVIFDGDGKQQLMSIRHGLSALQNCLVPLLKSNETINRLAIDTIRRVMQFSTHSYWLVKVCTIVMLIQTLSNLTFTS